jgi:hypothetical protein
VALVPDQGPVQQLTPAGAGPAFHDGVHPGHLNSRGFPAQLDRRLSILTSTQMISGGCVRMIDFQSTRTVTQDRKRERGMPPRHPPERRPQSAPALPQGDHRPAGILRGAGRCRSGHLRR